MGFDDTKTILKSAHTELRHLAEMSEGSDLYSSIVRHGDDLESLLYEIKRIRHYAKEFFELKLSSVERSVEAAKKAKEDKH